MTLLCFRCGKLKNDATTKLFVLTGTHGGPSGLRESVSALTDRECRFPSDPDVVPGVFFLEEDKQMIDLLTLNDGKTTLGPWKMDVEVVDIYDYHKNPNALLAHCKAAQKPNCTNHYMYAWCFSQNSDAQNALNVPTIDKPYIDRHTGSLFYREDKYPSSTVSISPSLWWNLAMGAAGAAGAAGAVGVATAGAVAAVQSRQKTKMV